LDILAALGVFILLLAMSRILRVMVLAPYLIGGAVMWYLMPMSGAHATIAGVLLAFAIPFSSKQEDESSPSHRLLACWAASDLPCPFLLAILRSPGKRSSSARRKWRFSWRRFVRVFWVWPS
jgi:hypothetical protein